MSELLNRRSIRKYDPTVKISKDEMTEILKYDHKVTKPITLDFSDVVAGSDGKKVVKAGSPISSAGVVANTSSAIGILWTDVEESNPNGTLIIHGFINTANAQSNSGLTIHADVKTALKMIAFE